MQNATLDQLKTTAVFANALRELDEQTVAERRQKLASLQEFTDSLPKDVLGMAKREKDLAEELEQLIARKSSTEVELAMIRVELYRIRFKGHAKRVALQDEIKNSADPRIITFIVWAQRARNLAQFASHFSPEGFQGDAANPAHIARAEAKASKNVHAVMNMVDECLVRAEEMRMEALSAEDIGRELDSMAARIYGAYNMVTGARSLPASYEGRLI